MSRVAVLLCDGTGLDADALDGLPVELVEGLCDSPRAAAAAARRAGASRLVLGLCDARPAPELVAALRRAGAEPFGIEAVRLSGSPPERARTLVAAATARLAALAPGERGKPSLVAAGISRRALFSAAVVAAAPVAVVDETRCAGPACGLCAEACPERAIDVAGPRALVDTGRCSACGICVGRCPHGALRLAGCSAAQVEAQLEELLPHVDGIVLACASARTSTPPGWASVELPSLGLVTPGWILQLASRGAPVRLAPCGGACCAGAGAVETFAARVLAACAAPGDGAAEPVRLTEPRATADAARRLGAHGRAAPVVGPASPLGLLALDAARCTLCGACASACPTGALELLETDEVALRHDASACVACARCVAACPEDAVAVERGLDAARLGGPTVLASARRESCRGCGAELPPPLLRRRLRELLPGLRDAPLELCAGCARKAVRETASAV